MMRSLVLVRHKLASYSQIVVLVTFVLIFLIFSLQAPGFLSLVSLTNILTLAAIKGLLVIGVAILMISGEFDLSVGSTLAVAAFVFALSIEAGLAPLPAMLLALVVSAVLGWINGVIVVKTGIPSFITTLGTMLAYRGLVLAIGSGAFARYTGEKVPLLFTVLSGAMDSLNRLGDPPGNARVSILWFVGFVVVAQLIMSHSNYGNWVYATGGRRGAALAQGVPIRRLLVFNFVLAAVLAGLAGLVQFAFRPAVEQLRGQGFELVAVAACVIGGISLQGGRGTVVGAAIGIVMIQMVEQGLILMGVNVEIFQATIGAILVLAVFANRYIGR
jgi:simple sugar transport system permease protein